METPSRLWSRALRYVALILLGFGGVFWLLDRTLFNWADNRFVLLVPVGLALLLGLASWWLGRRARRQN
ncbi:hypothetical protein Dcar01_01997 [Deinococcus carri]|uniref:Uncharacterized protein n=1 Tax=Deinococcus carri TaxID=1211323 RepID=A0ABP9W7D7_9DEIO